MSVQKNSPNQLKFVTSILFTKIPVSTDFCRESFKNDNILACKGFFKIRRRMRNGVRCPQFCSIFVENCDQTDGPIEKDSRNDCRLTSYNLVGITFVHIN